MCIEDNSGKRHMQATITEAADRDSIGGHQIPAATAEATDEDISSSADIDLTSLPNIVRSTNVRSQRQQLACQHEVTTPPYTVH